MAQGQQDEALGLLARLLKKVEAIGALASTIVILVLQAVILHAQGEKKQALAALERALSLAEPEGFVRTFIDEGTPMAHLLKRAIARGIATDYARALLIVLEDEMGGKALAPSSSKDLVDQLSETGEMKVKLPTTLGGSDHAGFYRRGIPVLFFFTGLTSIYHTPDDDFETINVEGAVQTIDFAYCARISSTRQVD